MAILLLSNSMQKVKALQISLYDSMIIYRSWWSKGMWMEETKEKPWTQHNAHISSFVRDPIP